MLPIAGTLYLTAAEAAARLGVSESRVRQLVMEGRLHPHTQFGTRLFLNPREVDKVRAEREAEANRPLAPRRSYYKPIPPSRQKRYKRPSVAQAERRRRLVRTRVVA